MTAAKYVRTARQDDSAVAQQLDVLAQLATKLDVEEARTYVDNGVSTELLHEDRPAFARLVLDIARGEVDTVLVVDVDRITRSPDVWQRFADFCHARRCAIELARYRLRATS